jgi:hypothetical protein
MSRAPGAATDQTTAFIAALDQADLRADDTFAAHVLRTAPSDAVIVHERCGPIPDLALRFAAASGSRKTVFVSDQPAELARHEALFRQALKHLGVKAPAKFRWSASGDDKHFETGGWFVHHRFDSNGSIARLPPPGEMDAYLGQLTWDMTEAGHLGLSGYYHTSDADRVQAFAAELGWEVVRTPLVHSGELDPMVSGECVDFWCSDFLEE